MSAVTRDSKTTSHPKNLQHSNGKVTTKSIDQPLFIPASQRAPATPAARKKSSSAGAAKQRVFDARPDGADFRDLVFNATLAEVPPRISLHSYLQYGVPVLDQGNEGACTGFGIATVANYLLRRRSVDPDQEMVSPRMMYEMAKRYDEWSGEDYSGSSARGAMKGWHKHGVCTEVLWPYHDGNSDRSISAQRANDALRRTLGAYYRVNHKDLVAMHSALVEVGILYATALVHEGWNKPNEHSIIEPNKTMLGGHAFAIVAYNEDGFWVQNSWGTDWGDGGFALLTYDDWLRNGTDVWVARLGVPIRWSMPQSGARLLTATFGHAQAFTTNDIRSHVVTVGNDGQLCRTGTYATSEADVKEIFDFEFSAATANWKKKRILLYAHGGLVAEKHAIEQVAKFRSILLESEVYPIAFVWKTDYWTTWHNLLQDALRQRQPEGWISAGLDFIRDRLDDALEPLVRHLSGKLQWDEMKENGILASRNEQGASRVVLKYLNQVLENDPEVEIHIAAHSAGAIFMAPFVQLLATPGKIKTGPMANKSGLGHKIGSCSLWAPAITMKLFKQSYMPAITRGQIDRFALYTLTDKAEQDDHCADIYHKSLLYLVSNGLEERRRIPWQQPDGEALLGMQKFVESDSELMKLFASGKADWVLAPNTAQEPTEASRSQRHGDFDNDSATLQSTLARILA